jgi:TonB family protein
MVLKTEEFYLNPAFELKQSIHSNTLKGFLTTMLLIVLLSISITFLPKTGNPISDTGIFSTQTTEVMEISPDFFVKDKIDNYKTEKNHAKTVFTGIEEVSGDINVVSDNTAETDIKEFATIEKIAIALSTKGEGVKINSSTLIEIKNIEKQAVKISKQDDEFVVAEILPSYDLSELQNNLKYPELARKIGLEGRVIISVIVDENGLLINEKILNSENEIFNFAALEAVKKTKFNPAVQNGIKIKCPMIIPIIFKIR